MAILTESFLSIGTTQNFIAVAILLLTARLTQLYFTTLRYPTNLPRVYEDPKATSFRWKTRLTYFTDCQNMFKEAYEKYSKHGKTVLIPGLGFRDEVILPNSALRWLTTQPPDVVSVYEAFAEMDQINSSLPHDGFVKDPWQGNLVKTGMGAILETLVAGLNDELQYAFDTRFGTDTEDWREIAVLETMKPLVAQAASRFTVGLPLCRNETYLQETFRFNDNFVINAGLLGVSPKNLRPILTPLAYIPMRWRLHKIKALFKPLYQERMKLLSAPKSPDEPQDHLQLMLRYAEVHRPKELTLNEMTGRLAIANLGSYHQTTLAVANILFNIIASDPEYNTLALLREEFSTILAASGGVWTKSSIAQMTKADSVCRETLRLQSFGGRAIIRMVVKEGGLETEDGILLPKGSMVSICSWANQTDGEHFPDPYKYDPFRYSRPREQEAEGAGKHTFVTTGPQYLPFGHGRHACPGRFLVDFELKMILAYVVLNYDLRFPESYGGVRPESKWVSEACFPPSGGKIEVKRRKNVV